MRSHKARWSTQAGWAASTLAGAANTASTRAWTLGAMFRRPRETSDMNPAETPTYSPMLMPISRARSRM